MIAARLLPPLVLALALSILAAPARSTVQAAGSGPAVALQITQVGYGFAGGGNYRLNGPSLLRNDDVWVPIHIVLRNGGGSDVTGHLVISDNGPQNGSFGAPSYRTDYTLDVALPVASHKAVTMYVRAADVGQQLTVNLQVGGATIATGALQPALQQDGSLSVGVLSDDTAARTTLRNIKFGDTATSVAQFDDAAPLDAQPQALENFDLIVLSNFSSDTLTAAQTDALRAWVQGGGTLLVAGGPDARKTMGHLPASLLAATLHSTIVAPALPELARIAGDPVTDNGPVELSVAAPRRGARVLAAHNGVPLAVDLPLGQGHLVYSALEPTLAPLNNWSVGAQGDFWSHLLAPALSGPLDALVQNSAQSDNSNFPSSNNTSITSDLNVIPTRSLPSLQFYTILVVLYILVLGPGNYILLRWRKRLEWSWLTIPAVAVLFGLGSFGLAYARNGGDVVAKIDTVVYLDSGATKTADSYIGIFVPFRGDYNLSSPGPALAWSLSDNNNGFQQNGAGTLPLGMRVDEGPQFIAHLLGLQMWSMRTLGVRQQLAMPGEVVGHLVLHGNNVSGEVTNNTNLTLRDCAIVGADGASGVIPAIAPHHTARVAPFSLNNNGNTAAPNGSTGPLTTLYSSGTGVNAAGGGEQAAGPSTMASGSRYSAILSAVFPNGSLATAGAPLALLGWSNAPLGQFDVDGAAPRRSDLDLVVAPLGLGAAPGRFALNPGDLPVGVIGTSVTPNSNGPGSSLSLNPGDHLDVGLSVPSTGRLTVSAITVQVNLNGGNSLTPTSAQLWNWRTGRWTPIDVSTGTQTKTNAAAFAAPDGRIRLRIVAPPSSSLTFNNIEQNISIGVTGATQ